MFINFNNFYCLKFSAKNFAIPRDENMLQGKIVSILPDYSMSQETKCFNTPNLYTTLTEIKSANVNMKLILKYSNHNIKNAYIH